MNVRDSSRLGMSVKMNVRGSSRLGMASTNSKNKTVNQADNGQMVDATTLLQILFPSQCRPTLRWLRQQQKERRVPFIKIGRFVFFDPTKVRDAMNSQRTAKFGGVN